MCVSGDTQICYQYYYTNLSVQHKDELMIVDTKGIFLERNEQSGEMEWL